MGDEEVGIAQEASNLVDEVKTDVANASLSSIIDQEYVKDNVLDVAQVLQSSKDLLATGQASFNTMNELSEWNSASEVIANIKTLNEFLIQVVYAVEAVVLTIDNAKDYITSEDKLDMAVTIVDNALKLPWYLEGIDGLVLKMLISSTVTFVNKIGGQTWDLSGILRHLQQGKEILER